MLIDLGKTRPNAVYRLRLIVTDSIEVDASTVVSLTTNGPPTSGTFAVSPYRGTALDDGVRVPARRLVRRRRRLPAHVHVRVSAGPGRGADAAGCGPVRKRVVPHDTAASAECQHHVPVASLDRLPVVRASLHADARADPLEISTEDLSAFAGDLLSASADTGDGEASLSLVSNVASVIGGTDTSRRRLSAEQELIDDLMAHTISAAELVGTGSSAAAAAQVLSTASTLTGDPDSLSESSQTGALGLLNDVVGGAAGAGFDADTAAATAATLSSLLSASLFASVAADARRSLGAACRPGRADGRHGGGAGHRHDRGRLRRPEQERRHGQPGAARLPDRLRDAGRGVSTVLGAGVTDLPASALDAAGGGSCDADASVAPADVDVKVARLKNVHASEGDGAISDLLQIELGGEGTTVKVDNLAEPIVFDIPFDYDPALEDGYDPGTDTGLCSDQSQVLTFNCDVPTTFDCGSHVVAHPLDVTVTCPAKTAACSFWDDATRGWSSDGCFVIASTASGVTCACTHLTEFAASTIAADADFVVSVREPTASPTSQPSPGPTTRPTWVPWPAPTTALRRRHRRRGRLHGRRGCRGLRPRQRPRRGRRPRRSRRRRRARRAGRTEAPIPAPTNGPTKVPIPAPSPRPTNALPDTAAVARAEHTSADARALGVPDASAHAAPGGGTRGRRRRQPRPPRPRRVRRSMESRNGGYTCRVSLSRRLGERCAGTARIRTDDRFRGRDDAPLLHYAKSMLHRDQDLCVGKDDCRGASPLGCHKFWRGIRKRANWS